MSVRVVIAVAVMTAVIVRVAVSVIGR